MEIILKEDIIGLGYKNDIVNVKSGYGRNYLIPKGLGVIASPSAKKVLAENLKQQASKLAALKAAAVERAKQLEGVELVIATKVSVTGVAYGSVGAANVAEELAKKGIDIDRKIITMHDAMGVRRETGEQAKVLNKMLEQWIEVTEKNNPFLQNMHLKEMVGHTPLQVMAGFALGILVGFLYPMGL